MEFQEVPGTDEEYLKLMRELKREVAEIKEVIKSERKGKRALTTKDTEAFLFSQPIITKRDKLKDLWPAQKADLEERLIKGFIEHLVPVAIDSDNPQLTYSIRTEGICLNCREKGPELELGYRNRPKPLALWSGFSYDELGANWKEKFVVDKKIGESEAIRGWVAPVCKRHKHDLTTMLISTRHVITVSNSRTSVIVVECRTKSGISNAYKVAEWLVGSNWEGKPRESINDYCATRLRASPYDTWAKTTKLLKEWKPQIDWYEAIMIRGYNRKKLDDDIEAAVEGHADLRGFYSSRIKNLIITEQEPLGDPGEPKHMEIFLPYEVGPILNQINHHSSTNKDYSGREGSKYSETLYKVRKEEGRIRNYSPLHWLVLMHIVLPIFADKYTQPFTSGLCESRLERLSKKE